MTMGLNGTFGDVVSVKRWYHVGEEEAPHLTMAELSSMTRGAGMLHRGGPLVHIWRRPPFFQLKTAVIFPGRLMKTTADILVRAYEGSFILCCTTSSGYQVGLLFATGQPSTEQPFLYVCTWNVVLRVLLWQRDGPGDLLLRVCAVPAAGMQRPDPRVSEIQDE